MACLWEHMAIRSYETHSDMVRDAYGHIRFVVKDNVSLCFPDIIKRPPIYLPVTVVPTIC